MISTQATIDSTELNALLLRLTSQFSDDGILAILQEAKRRIERITVLQYPTATHAPQADLWTTKQRRYFFWALRSGRIHVPYKRTGGLARALEVEIGLAGAGEFQLLIGIDDAKKPFAKYVVGKAGEQSRYFATRTRWQSLDKMIAKQLPAITQNVVTAFETILQDIADGPA